MTHDGETRILELLKRIAEATEKLVDLAQRSQAATVIEKAVAADASQASPYLPGKLTKKGK